MTCGEANVEKGQKATSPPSQLRKMYGAGLLILNLEEFV